MKKTLLIAILTLSIIFSTVSPVFADTTVNSSVTENDGYTIIYFEDGGKLKISSAVVEIDTVSRSNEKTINAYKTAYFEDGSGNREWEYTLNATFKYVEGVSSVCTTKYYAYNIYENGWSLSDASTTASGNVARGFGTFTKKILFVTIKTYVIDISLTCDIYGNVT